MDFPVPSSGRSSASRQIGSVLLLAGRVVLGGVFLYAAYTKLRHPWMLFAMSVDSYQMLPEWGVTLVARALPWLELALGALLILGIGLRFVATAASALLVGFFLVMLRSYSQGLGIDCGCFGFGEKLGVRTLLRDGALVAFSLVIMVGAFLKRRART
jgi:uncharacterized membrane protein YphA (DoxX/SURF4 family)